MIKQVLWRRRFGQILVALLSVIVFLGLAASDLPGRVGVQGTGLSLDSFALPVAKAASSCSTVYKVTNTSAPAATANYVHQFTGALGTFDYTPPTLAPGATAWFNLNDVTVVPSGFTGALTVLSDNMLTATVTYLDCGLFPNDPVPMIDSPAPSASVGRIVALSGWSVDRNAPAGTNPGVDAVHIYRDGPAGQGTVLGAATYGGSRPDVAAALQGAQFTNSGWTFDWNTAGLALNSNHTLWVYAHSSLSGKWAVSTREVTVVNPFALDPLVAIDGPAPNANISGALAVSGWAIDRNAATGTGVDQVHVYRDGLAGGGGVPVGMATYGGARPDVAGAFGSAEFTNSGWVLNWNTTGLAVGAHTLYIYAHSSATNNWSVTTRDVNVTGLPFPNDPLIAVDAPAENATVGGATSISGWAIDRNSATGTGIDMVHVYRDGAAGVGTPIGGATYGATRADVGAAFGARFSDSGWSLNWNTAGLTGQHVLYIYAHSTATDSWTLVTRNVNVSAAAFPNDPIIQVDEPTPNAALVGTTTNISGWAIDRNASTGTGVGQVHIYRDGFAGAGGVPLGVATYGNSRPDVGAFAGNAQFNNSGWAFAWDTTGLAAGPHTLYVYAQSSGSGTWTVTTVPVTK